MFRLPRIENGIRQLFMKYLLTVMLLCTMALWGASGWAWDGFDADTTELVEITPDAVPQSGDAINVKIYDTDTTIAGVVESVKHNRRTVEVIVRYPDGKSHMLVMEGR